MENESIGKRGMGINYKGSQGQTKRAVVLHEEEEEEEEEEEVVVGFMYVLNDTFLSPFEMENVQKKSVFYCHFLLPY
jgi:hypothetical protein